MSAPRVASAAPVRVLPAAVYDGLEALAAQYRGVGYGDFFYDGKPCCVYGMAARLDGIPDPSGEPWLDPRDTGGIAVRALAAAGITARDSDSFVRAALRATGVFGELDERAPFADWCRAGNIVRGDA